MKQFSGSVDVTVDLNDGGARQACIVVNGQPISLQAVAAVSPSMVAVLEQLARPEADGGVFRVERDGTKITLTRTGILAHFVNRAASLLPRQRVRA